jgi:TolB-like protein
MNRVKDIAIIVLLLAVVYLLATRNGTLTVSDDSQTAAVSRVVLPYVNVGRDPDDEYLSNSVWNETINSLANHPELRIVSRTSSSRFKGVNEDIRAIGEELGVSYVLEGAVRKTDTTVRITAQLIRVDDESHVWSNSYDSDADSVDSIPLLIADSVAREIKSIL